MYSIFSDDDSQVIDVTKVKSARTILFDDNQSQKPPSKSQSEEDCRGETYICVLKFMYSVQKVSKSYSKVTLMLGH